MVKIIGVNFRTPCISIQYKGRICFPKEIRNHMCLMRVIILFDNYRLPLSVGSLIVLT